MKKAGSLASAVANQIASNSSALGHEAHFAAHRARVTREIVARAPAGGAGRLCLLGVGNANDVELEALADAFREIHLVDIDADAVARAIASVDEGRRAKLVARAPFDASGLFEKLDAWAAAPPDDAALEAAAVGAIARVVGALARPFDVVVSCALLTQLQLVLLEVVGDRHPRFAQLRAVLTTVHVRILCGLLAPGGVALLVTDLASSDMARFDALPPGADLAAVMNALVQSGNVIYAAHPGRLFAQVLDVPDLKAQFSIGFAGPPWLWRNGPSKTFLVYALEIKSSRAAPR